MHRSPSERSAAAVSPSLPVETAPAPSHTRYQVILWLCMGAVVAYICRNSIAVAESTIRRDMGLSEKQMGLVMSAFLLTYAIGQIPSGLLADRWGSRRTLPALSVAWSLATGAMGLATGLWGLIAARLVIGGAQAGLFPSTTSTVSKWIPIHERGLANGALGSSMSLGGAIGAALTGVALVYMDWRWVFVSFTLLGLIWARLFYAWFRDLPEEHPGVNQVEREHIAAHRDPKQNQPHGQREPTPWAAIFSSPAMGWICGQQFFRAAAYMFFASWFPTYLQETTGVSVQNSGLLTMLPLFGVVFGTLLGGIVSDWVLRRTGSLRWSRQGLSVATLLAAAAFAYAPNLFQLQQALVVTGLISLSTFSFGVSSPCGYSITIDMGGVHLVMVFSVMNMSGNVGGLVFPYLVPLYRQWTGTWESVLPLFASLYVAAAVCWLMLDTKGTIMDQAKWGREKGSDA